MTEKCISCGKFVGHNEIIDGDAQSEIVTTIDGDEIEWECSRCVSNRSPEQRAMRLIRELQADFGNTFEGRHYRPMKYPGGPGGNGHNRVSKHVVYLLEQYGFPPKK